MIQICLRVCPVAVTCVRVGVPSWYLTSTKIQYSSGKPGKNCHGLHPYYIRKSAYDFACMRGVIKAGAACDKICTILLYGLICTCQMPDAARYNDRGPNTSYLDAPISAIRADICISGLAPDTSL